jgi:GH25 family lysozyme M1 (1,4-beta-N-acetylmuramidase)
MTLTRAHGFDLSHWQGFYKPVPVPPRPVDFVIQKLSEAVYPDLGYEIIKAQIRPVPVKGGYHFFRAGWSWRDQMDIFLSMLDGYDFWALDVEKISNYSGLPILNKPARGFVEMVPLALAYLIKYSSRPGLIYTGMGVWDWLFPVASELAKYDLWIAQWYNARDPEGMPNYYRKAPTMRPDWRFWQYDNNGQGGRGLEYGVGSAGLDLDVFNGTVEQLTAWAKPAPVPPPVWPTRDECINDILRKAGYQWQP